MPILLGKNRGSKMKHPKYDWSDIVILVACPFIGALVAAFSNGSWGDELAIWYLFGCVIGMMSMFWWMKTKVAQK